MKNRHPLTFPEKGNCIQIRLFCHGFLCIRLFCAESETPMRSADLFLLSTALFSLHSIRVLSLMASVGHLYHFAAGTGRESLQGSRDLLFRSFQVFTVFDVSSLCFPLSCLRPYYTISHVRIKVFFVTLERTIMK